MQKLHPRTVSSIVPIGHPQLTQADITALMAFGRQLVSERIAYACVPCVTDDGSPLVALLDSTRQQLLYAVCKESGWYYAIDSEGDVLVGSHFLHELLEALPVDRQARLRRCC